MGFRRRLRPLNGCLNKSGNVQSYFISSASVKGMCDWPEFVIRFPSPDGDDEENKVL